MEAITGIVMVLIVLSMSLVITRIATTALVFTGVSQDLARFQARSAFTCCGFTTAEAEQIATHPVRRRIVMLLMLLGNGTVVLAITSLVPVFVSVKDASGGYFEAIGYRLVWLALGLLALWWIASSRLVDRYLSRAIAWSLRRFTHLDVHDYLGLLRLSQGFTVSELLVAAGDWVVGRNLAELRLSDEGVQVLGIHRASGDYVGTPSGTTYIRNGDKLVLYGRIQQLSELDERRAGPEGDRAHEQRCQEQHTLLEAQERDDLRAPRKPRTADKAAPQDPGRIA